MKKALRFAHLILINIKNLSLKDFLQLCSLGLSHPLWSLLTFWATVKTFTIVGIYFPNKHNGNGIGNAFRHALWNCLILMYCCKVSSPKKALIWTEKITNLHEQLFPNPVLQKKMDLHNNKIGRDLFMKLLPGIHRQFFESSFFITPLLELTESIKTVHNTSEIYGTTLVKIEE